MDTYENYRIKLREIIDYSFAHGTEAVGLEQFSESSPSEWNEDVRTKFIIACHDGFKKAQELLIEQIKNYQENLRKTTKELKEYRRQKDKSKEKETQNKISIINQRLSNFSHIADGIAWQLLGGQIHIARRFHLQIDSSKFLDSSNVKHAISVAEEINKNPKDFALISDLTNSIQIGDLLIKHGDFIGIMELKEGKVNDMIKEFFESMEKAGGEISKEMLTDRFNIDTVKQIERMQRQQKRAEKAIDVINNDKGIDPVSEEKIIVSTPTIQTEYYHEELNKLYNDLKEKIWAYTVIDTCLHIGMYRDEGIVMAKGTIELLLKQKTDNYILIDWLSITENLSEPIFSKPFPPDFIVDILTGKVKIILGLDLDALIATFNHFGVNTRWLTEKETTKNKQIPKAKGMVVVNKKGIAFKLESGHEVLMSGGIISKILYDSIEPSNIALTLLSTHYNLWEQAEENGS